jgi:hypothetical protein
MKSNCLFLLTGIILNIFGCSNFSSKNLILNNRYPAESNITVDDVMSVKKTLLKSQRSIQSEVVNYVQKALNYSCKVEFISSDLLPNDVAFKVEFDFINHDYFLRIYHSPDAFNYHESAEKLSGMIDIYFRSKEYLNNPYAFFEMYYNAKANDLEALNNFLKINNKAEFVNLHKINETTNFELMTLMKNEMKAETEKKIETLRPLIKKMKQRRSTQKEIRKTYLEVLDNESDENQLKTLVARNDRVRVAELIKKYLPFEDMAPFEKKYWENYLDIIAHPVPLNKRILIYRGLEGDQIYPAYSDGNFLDKQTAIKEGNAFLMSTLLTKNQGSWNRRLRSLEAMNEKFITTVNDSTEYTKSARMLTMFSRHAGKPKGSPFLSFTPQIDIALFYGKNQNAAFLIDPRLLQFNFVTFYTNEREFLTGLITFPDEMVGIWTFNDLNKDQEQFYQKRLANLIENKFGIENRENIIEKISSNSDHYFKDFPYKNNAHTPAYGRDFGCSSIIKHFWKN